jgi:uncharacterized protein with ATP-grasp and redox domains
MKSDLECLICLLRQAKNTAQAATADKALQREIMNRAAAMVEPADLNLSPAELSTPVYRMVSEITGTADPYLEIKESTNREALRLLPRFREMLASAPDPLDAALHGAAAGNIIDLGVGHTFDLEEEIERILETPFAVHDLEEFRSELRPGRSLLYLGDNSGEIIFDRVLVDVLLEFGVKITFVVKSAPVINDAMMEDAKTAGLTERVPVIETGSGDIGVNLENASAEFLRAFDSADLILAKGHGNFESCEDLDRNFYFLLKAKCEVVARALGVRCGDIVFKKSRRAG